MPFDQAKWDELVSQFEADEPGVSDVETPPVPAENPTVLPEMDLSGDDESAEPVPDDEAAEGELPAPPSMPQTALAAPIGTDVARGARSDLAGRPGAAPPPPESLDWKGLAERLKMGSVGKAQSKGYESLFANVGAQSGYRPNAAAGDVLTETARIPLDVAKEKQGFESRDLAMKGQKAALGAKAAMDDPNSLQSQKARDAIRSFFPEQQMPAGFDSWSANDVSHFANSGTLGRLADDRRAQGVAQAKAQAGEEKAATAAQSLADMRKQWAPELKAAGKNPATATEFDVRQVMSAKHAAATEKMAVSNNALARAAEGRRAGDYASLGQAIPFAGGSLKYTGAGSPREEDVREAQKTAGLYGAAIAGMDDLEGAMQRFAQSPGVETRDEVVAKTQAVAGHLNTALGQGAMSKDEKAEMSKALGVDITTPGGIQAIVNTLTGDDRAAAAAMTRRLKAVRSSTRASALGKLAPYHFGEAGQSGGGSVKMKFPDGSVHDVPPDKLEKAKTKGGVPVNG